MALPTLPRGRAVRELSGGRRLVKTVFDRNLALLALDFLSPVLLGIAAAIQFTREGPAICRQERVGTHGETFTLKGYPDDGSRVRARACAHRWSGDRYPATSLRCARDPRTTSRAWTP